MVCEVLEGVKNLTFQSKLCRGKKYLCSVLAKVARTAVQQIQVAYMNHMGSNDWMNCDEREILVAANSPGFSTSGCQQSVLEKKGVRAEAVTAKVPVVGVAVAFTGFVVAQDKRDGGQDVTGAQTRLLRASGSEDSV